MEIDLKGQMVSLSGTSEFLMFIGSPRLVSLDDLKEKRMFLSDIPRYDVTRELLLLNQQRIAELELK